MRCELDISMTKEEDIMYEMKDEYRTGIELIDQEHTRLFEIADELYELIQNEFIPDKYDYIVDVLNGLKEYAATHFKDEEEYMESIQYKKLFTQKIQHNAFIEKMESIELDDLDADQQQSCLDLLEFINDWLVHHILENDLLIGK